MKRYVQPIRRVGSKVRNLGRNLFGVGSRRVVNIAAVLVIGISGAGTLWPQAVHAGASSQGPQNSGTQTGVNTCVTGTGTNAWTSIANVATQNATNSTVSLASLALSQCVEATNFGFTIPSTATINGIKLDLYRSVAATSSKAQIQDLAVRLIKGGAVQTTDRSTSTGWTATNTDEAHGSNSDLWGATLAPSDINASNFGIAFAAQNVKISGTGATLTAQVDYIGVTVYYTTPSSHNLAAYRWYSWNGSTESALAAQNTALSSSSIGQGTEFHLRYLDNIGTSQLDLNGQTFKLQYAQRGTDNSCDTSFTGETYTDVGSGNAFNYYASTMGSDGSSITDNGGVTDGANTRVPEDLIESTSNYGNTIAAIPSGQDGLWDVALTNVSASGNTDYCFRVVKSDGSLLDTYTVIPELVTAPASFAQNGYRWFNNNNTTGMAPVLEDVSSGRDVINDIAVDSTNGYLYAVGSDSTPGYNEWRIEKRDLTTGALIYGISESDSFDSRIAGIAIDVSGGFMYLAGNNGGSNGNGGWKIEKRALSDGSLASGYTVTEDPTAANDSISAIAIDVSGGFMYLAGTDASVDASEWRIEKRTLSTGSLTTGYTVTENPSNNSDLLQTIAIDTTGGFMYLGGSDVSASGGLRLEKRLLSTGALVTAFGSSGIVSEQVSSTRGTFNKLAIDTSGGFLYAVGYDSNGSGVVNKEEIRIEKRDLTGGSTTTGYAISEDLTSSNDYANSIVLDTANGNFYIAGADNDTSGGSNPSEYRIEKRALSNGSLTASLSHQTTALQGVGEEANSIAMASGWLYLGGTTDLSNLTGGNAIRIEQRNTTDLDVGPAISALAAVNTRATSPSQGSPVRLRALIGISSSPLGLSGQSFKLQEAAAAGPPGSAVCSNSLSYSDVNSSSGAFQFYDNSNLTDGGGMVTTSKDPTDGSNTVFGENYLESNTNFTNDQYALSVNSDGEFDAALYNAAAFANVTYCFRIVKSDGSLLSTYNFFPAITATSTPITDQQLRGGEWFDSSLSSGEPDQPFFW